jgi:hypothetical protein
MSYLSTNKFIEPESFPTLRCYTVWLYRQIEKKTYLFLDCAGRLLYPRKFLLCHQKLQPSLMCYQNFQNSLCDITSNFLSPMSISIQIGVISPLSVGKKTVLPLLPTHLYMASNNGLCTVWIILDQNFFGPLYFQNFSNI